MVSVELRFSVKGVQREGGLAGGRGSLMCGTHLAVTRVSGTRL